MATDFNVGAGVKAPRKLLMTYVDVSDDGSTPEWELVGRGVEDSSIDLNPSTETTTDILGITDTSVTKWEPSQSLDPNTVKSPSFFQSSMCLLFMLISVKQITLKQRCRKTAQSM